MPATVSEEVLDMSILAPQTHERLSHAAKQLLAENKRSLGLEDSHELDNQTTQDTPDGEIPKGKGHKSFGGTGSRPNQTGSGYSYAHASQTRFGDQQSDLYREKQIQVSYLDCLAARIPAPGSFQDELQTKENLRVQLTTLAQEALESYAHDHGYAIGPRAIDLKCFGSLRNGFMLPNAGLDLVMRNHPSSFPIELGNICSHILEKAFLDAGFGAHLLSNTKVPTIKLCEKPSKQFLDTLKREHERRQTKEAQQLSGTQIDFQSGLFDPNQLRFRHRVASVDFPQSGAGVQCDINLSGRLALYNTELLRCYALCDERVRLLGIFVKMWAKKRKINDPHNGTLCSYGYIIMVIHYLMNVANPPVIPNLQVVQRPFSGHVEIANVDGYDIRFFNDERELRAISKCKGPSGNTQSVGELLRGFFAYYGGRDKGSRQNFHWAYNTISIRIPGGILPKYTKGWSTARTDDDGTRLRFLIAIEDPFEHDHNVASTVTENGLSAIKSEFKRAQTIITRIQEIPGVGWEWRTDEGDVGQDFLAEAKYQPKWNSAHRFNTLQKHLDCVPELCTACMESSPAQGSMKKTQNTDGHVAQSSHAQRKPIHTEKPARRDTSNEQLSDKDDSTDHLPGASRKVQGPDGHTVMKYDAPERSSLALLPSPPPVCGVVLDSRQFHGPNAIRDRNAAHDGYTSSSWGHESALMGT